MSTKIKTGPIRVVVVDDSLSVRELLVALLHNSEGMQVVGVGSNGEEAVRLVHRLRPDVVTMDVLMPKMDGLEATRRIMCEVPTPIVVVTANMMRADIDLTFEALQAGALTVIRKPGLNDPENCEKLVQTVCLMSGVPVIHHWGRDRLPGTSTGAAKSAMEKAGAEVSLTRFSPGLSSGLRQALKGRDVRIIGIGSSTGGPAALAKVLRPLPADFAIPILAVQHITPGFVSGLAEWLDKETALHVSIAGPGDTPQPGTVLFAPDDYHMELNAWGVVELNREPPYAGLRPSANYLFHSLARNYGVRAAGVILTGMGDDGVEGLVALHRSGGVTLAQDEASCVVYGMPREAAARGAVDQVMPLELIALSLEQLDAKRVPRREASHG
ncbi:MAG: chemotaxis-specific protein-glutamate methyltransferase CheB [Anaerolineae bacterium]|nr:chemotaxis-specific protein-glutamate methyltransferase CheB [Anaerolineae bacterium]